MKILVIIVFFFSFISAHAQVLKFRAKKTEYKEKDARGKWKDWESLDTSCNILVVRDLTKNTFTTYGEKENTFSIISSEKYDDPEKTKDLFKSYTYVGVDQNNEKFSLILRIPVDKEANYYVLIIARGYNAIKFLMERE